MRKQAATLVTCLVLGTFLCPNLGLAQSQVDTQTEIQEIKQKLAEMDELKARLAELEKKLAETQKAQEAAEPSVTTAFKGAKAKIDGRIFAGTFATGDQGPDPNWSTDINDAKLRFTFTPSKRITIVNRLNASGAKVGDFDYFYLDYAGALYPSSIIRLGQRKIDVGQETWVDNPVENILITNSISHVSGYGTGLALRGRIGSSDTAPIYEVGFVNGPKGVMVRPTSSLPYNVKIGTALPMNLFASASYFDSGRLLSTDSPAINVAELSSAPAGSTQWDRKLWELDLRYGYGPDGIRSIIPSANLPRLMLGATYGQFNDDSVGAPDRDGSYWFVEGLYNLTSKLYTAARYSTVKLDDDVLANLGKSPVAVNSYNRTSIGLGYRLTDLTDVKTEYTVNETSGGTPEPSLNQWAVGVASKF